jgi:hypothetical protein
MLIKWSELNVEQTLGEILTRGYYLGYRAKERERELQSALLQRVSVMCEFVHTR